MSYSYIEVDGVERHAIGTDGKATTYQWAFDYFPTTDDTDDTDGWVVVMGYLFADGSFVELGRDFAYTTDQCKDIGKSFDYEPLQVMPAPDVPRDETTPRPQRRKR
jgi:hypothetical protein